MLAKTNTQQNVEEVRKNGGLDRQLAAGLPVVQQEGEEVAEEARVQEETVQMETAVVRYGGMESCCLLLIFIANLMHCFFMPTGAFCFS